MPTVSGKNLISETTEKVIRRAVVIASTAILAKIYDVPLNDLKVLGMELPPSLFDTVLLILVFFHMYSLVINWVGDLAAFRLWYRESSIWSEFDSNLKLDKTFINGAVPLMLRLHQLEKEEAWPPNFLELNDDAKREYNDFKTNVELYTGRLEYAGTKFSVLTWFGRYYIWIHSFAFPLLLCVIATYLLMKYGVFTPPNRL